MTDEVRQRQFAQTRVMLRRLCSRYAPQIRPAQWLFERSAQGKLSLHPQFSSVALQFSLSHTRGLMAIAFSGGMSVGVDFERLDRRGPFKALAARYFSTQEADALSALKDPLQAIRFLDLWTLKEASAKARGTGLAGMLADSFVWNQEVGRLSFFPQSPLPAPAWQFWQAHVTLSGDYAIAVALANAQPQVPGVLHARWIREEGVEEELPLSALCQGAFEA